MRSIPSAAVAPHSCSELVSCLWTLSLPSVVVILQTVLGENLVQMSTIGVSHISLQENLRQYVDRIFNVITKSGVSCPTVMCDIFFSLREAAAKRFQGESSVATAHAVENNSRPSLGSSPSLCQYLKAKKGHFRVPIRTVLT